MVCSSAPAGAGVAQIAGAGALGGRLEPGETRPRPASNVRGSRCSELSGGHAWVIRCQALELTKGSADLHTDAGQACLALACGLLALRPGPMSPPLRSKPARDNPT